MTYVRPEMRIQCDILGPFRAQFFSCTFSIVVKCLHVREEPPCLVSPLRIVDERGAVRHRPCPGHGHRLASVVSEGEDGVEVESQLGEGEEDHDQGGGAAGELLHVGKHPGHALEGRLLL